MIKASDIGLEKADYNNDVFAEHHKQQEEFYQMVVDKQDENIFNELNIPRIHTTEELIALMRYKAQNIKAQINPTIFIEVAEILENQQKALQECQKDEI